MLHILLPLSFVFSAPPTLPDTFPGEAPVISAEEPELPVSNDPAGPEGAVDTAPTQEVPEVPQAPLETGACPCQPNDWECRRANIVGCSDGVVDPIEGDAPRPELSPALEKSIGEHRPTMAERYRQRRLEADSSSSSYAEIRGAMLEFGLGLGGCWQAFCSLNPLSVLAHGGLGYRKGRIALVARVMGGGGPRTDVEGSLRMFGLDVGLELFPLRNPSFDPYFGIGLGYLRVADVGPINTDQGTFDSAQVFVSQGGVRASAGWPFLLGERWALGPRFDYVWGFSGDFCASIAGSEADCISASSLVNQVAGPARADRRAVRRTSLPRPWVMGLELRRRF